MLTGVYSGGTPNLASIKTALDVDPNTYILTHSYDIVLSAIFLFFVILIHLTYHTNYADIVSLFTLFVSFSII